MSCESRAQVDIAAFVAEPRAAEWAAFRAHYPGCRECSAEMLRWAALEGALRSVTDFHPAEELLLAYRRAPERLSREQRDELAAHLEACGPCRDALGAVVSIDLKRLLAVGKPAAAPEPARAGLWQGLLESLRGLFALPTPTLAGAALALLLLALGLPYLYRGWGELSGELPPPSARHEEAQELPREAPQPEPELLARELPPAPVPEARPVPEAAPPPAPEVAPLQLAEEKPGHAPEPAAEQKPALPPSRPAPPRPETWIVASLGPEPLLYSAPGGLPAGRIGGSARAGAAVGSVAVALVPERVGLTLEARPTLYFYLPAASSQPLQLRVNDLDAMKTLLSTTLRPPLAAGVHALRLADHGVTLAQSRNYEWLVSAPGSGHEGSGGILRRVAPPESLSAALARADAAQRVRLLAGSGIWYDALDILSRSIAKRPQDAQLRSGRAELLEQVGLTAPAAWDRGR
jgi:hypothetical protein